MPLSDYIIPGPYQPSLLFGPLENPLGMDMLFLPLWKSVETPLLPLLSSCQEHFLPGALSSLRREFLSFCRSVWIFPLNETLSKMSGPTTGSWESWFSQEALSLLEDNRLFCEMEKAYPVFSQKAVVCITQERSLVEDLLNTLVGREKEIREFFFSGASNTPLLIRGIYSTGSDRHGGGKIIQRIEYENGLRLIWRPRDLKIDRAFSGWLDYLCDRAMLPHFRHCRSFDLYGGSLCEFISHEPLSSLREAAFFFRNAGFLLGAVYMLGGGDCHAENVIACGQWPILIDTETALHCFNRIEGDKEQEAYSLERVGFLPFCGAGPGMYPCQDNLTFPTKEEKNLPCFNGRHLSALQYPRETCEGFSLAMEVWEKNREEAAKKVQELFAGTSFRFVLRSTRFYATMLSYLSSPSRLCDPALYEQGFELLTHNPPKVAGKEAMEELLKIERTALEQLDIPLFYETVGPKGLSALRERILSVSRESMEEDKEKVAFLLSSSPIWEAHPQSLPYPMVGNSPARETLSSLAERLLHCLETSYGVVTPRNTGKSYLMNLFLTMPEGGMGALMALSSYSRLWKEERILEGIKRFISQLEASPYLMSPSLSHLEPGLCEGIGGLLLSLGFLEDWDYFSKALFDFTLTRSGVPFSKLSQSPYLGYGQAGLLMGLQRLSQGVLEQYPDLRTLKKELSSSLEKTLTRLPSKESETGGSRARGDALLYGREGLLLALGKKTWADLYGGATDPGTEEPLLFSDNLTLVYGMAGVLYAKTLKRERGAASPLEEAYAKALLRADYPRSPKGTCAAGLFYGEAGKLYALCKYLDPEAIPDLFPSE